MARFAALEYSFSYEDTTQRGTLEIEVFDGWECPSCDDLSREHFDCSCEADINDTEDKYISAEEVDIVECPICTASYWCPSPVRLWDFMMHLDEHLA